MRRVYLDYSSTTPVDERVVTAMMPYLTSKFGNASSVHLYGQEARAGVDNARRQIAELINANSNEIVFTSGGTEANNLAIRGFAEAAQAHGRHIITSVFEHAAVREVCDDLERKGWDITRLPVGDSGVVCAEDVRAALRPETVLVSVMMVNNEVGTIQPIAEIGKIINRERERRGNLSLRFHTDAVQAVGKIPIDVQSLGCDLLSMSAHKLYAPKGVGALYVKRGVRLAVQNIGGHQERERRGGTEAVYLIVAFGEAVRLAKGEMNEREEHTRRLRNRFEDFLRAKYSGLTFNGADAARAAHISNVCFNDLEGEALLINLDLQGIAVSTGSACSSGSIEPSPVLLALGRTREQARSAIRFSFGKDTREADLDFVLERLPRAVESLRAMTNTLTALTAQ